MLVGFSVSVFTSFTIYVIIPPMANKEFKIGEYVYHEYYTEQICGRIISINTNENILELDTDFFLHMNNAVKDDSIPVETVRTESKEEPIPVSINPIPNPNSPEQRELRRMQERLSASQEEQIEVLVQDIQDIGETRLNKQLQYQRELEKSYPFIHNHRLPHSTQFNNNTYYYYTYMIYHKNIKKYYYGMRKCKGSPFKDTEYMGSSRLLRERVLKDGKSRYAKIILHIYDNFKYADLHETKLINMCDNFRSEWCYNLNNKMGIAIRTQNGRKVGEIPYDQERPRIYTPKEEQYLMEEVHLSPKAVQVQRRMVS